MLFVIWLLEFKQQPNNQVVQKYVIFFNYFSSSNKTDVLILMGKNMSQFSIAFPNATVGNNFTIFSFAVSKLLDLTVFNEMINRSHFCKFSIANNHAHKYFFSCRKNEIQLSLSLLLFYQFYSLFVASISSKLKMTFWKTFSERKK